MKQRRKIVVAILTPANNAQKEIDLQQCSCNLDKILHSNSSYYSMLQHISIAKYWQKYGVEMPQDCVTSPPLMVRTAPAWTCYLQVRLILVETHESSDYDILFPMMHVSVRYSGSALRHLLLSAPRRRRAVRASCQRCPRLIKQQNYVLTGDVAVVSLGGGGTTGETGTEETHLPVCKAMMENTQDDHQSV